MSEVARLSPIDPQVMSKRAGKFFQVERQSPLEAFQAVRYLREYALTGLDATMHLLLNRMVTPQTALDTASRMATDLVQPILGKIDPYDLGALKLDSSLAIGYCQRVASPQDSRKRTQRDTDVRALVEKFPAHEFVIDAGEAAALGLNVCPPDETLANLFEELIPHLGEVKQYIGLLPGTEGSP
jgi:hypothetical protein